MLLVMGYGFYMHLDQWRKIPHDKLTTVYSTKWDTGEYQTCETFNQPSQEKEPELDCATGDLPKVFVVRFWGRTYVPGRSNLVVHTWRCRKNGDADPVITCEYLSGTLPPIGR